MKKELTLTAFALMLAMGSLQARSETTEDATKKDTYPLTTCVVSGDKLDAMGEPYVYMHEGQEVRFCCKDCVNDFKKKPEKYLAKLKKAQSMEAEGESGHDHGSHGKSDAAKNPEKKSAHGDHSGHNH